MTLENLQFVISLITLLGFAFVAYRTFRDPDVKADKAIEILREQAKAEREIASQTIKTVQNDVHSLCIQVEEQRKEIVDLGVGLTRLQTIIDERIPKRL